MKQTFCRTCCRLLKASSNKKKKNKQKNRVHVYLSISVPLRALYACTQCLPIFSFALKFGETSKRVCEFLLYLVTYFFSDNDFFTIGPVYFNPNSKTFFNFHRMRIFERLASWKTTTPKKKKWKTNFTLTCSFQKVIRTRRFK